MRIASFVFAALATLTVASPVAVVEQRDLVVARDVSQVTASVQIIQKKVAALSKELQNAAPGKFLTALSVLGKNSDVDKALENETKVLKHQDVLNFEDSTTVGLKVLTELQPQITQLIDLLIAKKPAFEKVFGIGGNFTGLVHNNLLKSKALAQEFAAAFIAVLDPGFTAIGLQVADQIGAEFDRAIAAYKPPA